MNPDINMDDANLDVNNDINNNLSTNKDNTDIDISNDNANNEYEPIPDVDLMGDSHMMMGGDDMTNVNGEYKGNDDNEVFMPDNVNNNDDNVDDMMQNSIDLIDNVGNYNNMGMGGNNDEVLGFDNDNDDIVIKENKNNNLKDYDDLGEIEISKYI